MTLWHLSTKCVKVDNVELLLNINSLTWEELVCLNHMEQHRALFYIFQLSEELSKNVSLYYHIGHLFGHSGKELMLLLLYSHFSYKLSFYAILMAKYLSMSSFPLFSIHLHQHNDDFGNGFLLFSSVKSFKSPPSSVARPYCACTKTLEYP